LRTAGASDDLITHELCHVWQMQHKPFAMPFSYVLTGYGANPFERQARAAVAATKAPVGPADRGSTRVDPRRANP
jgi:hypothetical protein